VNQRLVVPVLKTVIAAYPAFLWEYAATTDEGSDRPRLSGFAEPLLDHLLVLVRQLASVFDLWRLDAWSQQSGKKWAGILKLIFWKVIDERVDFIPDCHTG
jgi:hypothetical protein